MTPRTLYEKLWESHLVHQDADGTALIYIDRHLVHEVTSPQAFEGLEVANRKPWRLDSAAEEVIGQRTAEPMIIVGIDHAGTGRVDEYTPTRDTMRRRSGQSIAPPPGT